MLCLSTLCQVVFAAICSALLGIAIERRLVNSASDVGRKCLMPMCPIKASVAYTKRHKQIFERSRG